MILVKKCIMVIALLLGICPMCLGQKMPSRTVVEKKNEASDQPVTGLNADSSHLFDVIHYRLDLQFPFRNSAFSGIMTATCLLEQDSPDDVAFDMVDLTADSVFLNGESVDFMQHSGEIHIPYQSTIMKDQPFEVSIYYHGAPQNAGFYFYSMCAYTYTEPSESRYWFPCHDVPWDKATVELHVTVPVGIEVASIGLLEKREISRDGLWETFHWRTNHPVAPYLVCVTMSFFYAHWSDWYISPVGDSIELAYYVFTRDSSDAKKDFIHMADAVDFFSDRFGAYPFEKYGMAEVEPFVMGGMEHQTMTTVNSRWIQGDRKYEKGLVHELAHMWWGDAVTLNDWPAIWLNEGFATYSEALFSEYQYGQDSFHDIMAYSKRIYLDQRERLDFPLYDPPPDELYNNGIVYNKGGWILHMLRHVVGEESFWKILSRYYDTYCYSNASIPEFQSICEAVSGMDLDWFFDEWIYQKGYIQVEYTWASRLLDSNHDALVLSVQQAQDEGPLFRMPLDIRINGADAFKDTIVWIEQSTHHFLFSLDFNPSNVVLDPHGWILMDAQYIQDGFLRSSGIPGQFNLFQNFQNPFNEMSMIYYDLLLSRNDWAIDLTVYDLLGRRIRMFL